VRFVETPVFTEAIADLVADDDYTALQLALIMRPDSGVVIPGSGGIRKMRWGLSGRGKRGGLRIVYFFERAPQVFYMLYVYRKSEASDLTQAQIRFLRRLVALEFS